VNLGYLFIEEGCLHGRSICCVLERKFAVNSCYSNLGRGRFMVQREQLLIALPVSYCMQL
ncbi:MAG: hypothetical protein AB8A49_08705, partial [Prochlorococcus sp.]